MNRGMRFLELLANKISLSIDQQIYPINRITKMCFVRTFIFCCIAFFNNKPFLYPLKTEQNEFESQQLVVAQLYPENRVGPSSFVEHNIWPQ